MPSLPQVGLFVARLTISAWIGAAVVFVIVGVREVTSPDFSDTVKDQLVVLRFPVFYAAGFSLVSLSLAGCLLTRPDEELSRRGRMVACGLLVVTLASMLGDYFAIYQPLLEIVIPPGRPRPRAFQTLHQWSARINSVNLLLCLVVACCVLWPHRPLDASGSTAKLANRIE